MVRSCHRPSRNWPTTAGLLCLLATAACGGEQPSAPTTTTDRITVRIINSLLGQVAVRTWKIGEAPSASICISDLGLSAIDVSRAALYEGNSGNALGRFVNSTTDGTIQIPMARGAGTYDLFVMSTQSGVDYGALEERTALDGQGAGKRYVTLRMAGAAERLMDLDAVADSDEAFRFMVDQFNRALAPHGVPYGRIEFVGTAATADITAGWVGDTGHAGCGPCIGYGAGPGQFWVNHRLIDMHSPDAGFCLGAGPSYLPRIYGGAPIMQGLAATFLGVSGRNCFYPCLLLTCSGAYLTDPKPPLTAAGADIVRYWALMNGRLQ